MEARIYRIDGFYLSTNWKPKGEIFFAVRGGETEKEHKEFCNKEKERLIDEHDDNYTSWRFTGEIFKDLGCFDPYASIIAFRVRENIKRRRR